MSSDDIFYEIEYDASPIPGVGKFVRKSVKIQDEESDEIRDRFRQMREISWTHRSEPEFRHEHYRFVQRGSSEIFYKQALFMQDFIDDYTESAQYVKYFPAYQTMGYEQLRTYFTWRAKVRAGHVDNISISYAFVYLYELLMNVGVSSSSEALERLVSFWRAFREYDNTVDRYLRRWFKDYHVYYELAHSFNEFVTIQQLKALYPEMVYEAEADDEKERELQWFYSVSKYDPRKSIFFTEENAKLINKCIIYVIGELKALCAEHGESFEDYLCHTPDKLIPWTPFANALFVPWVKQRDRRVVLSQSEVYICEKNRWMFRNSLVTENGKLLLGFVMKACEAKLRDILGFRRKLKVNLDINSNPFVSLLESKGIHFYKHIFKLVAASYHEETKTVVEVDDRLLTIIRKDALEITEKLIVDGDDVSLKVLAAAKRDASETESAAIDSATVKHIKARHAVITDAKAADITTETQEQYGLLALGEQTMALNEVEKAALAALICGTAEFRKTADELGIMQEVLIDMINEKAIDYIGDNLIDEDFDIYDEYREQIEEMLR